MRWLLLPSIISSLLILSVTEMFNAEHSAAISIMSIAFGIFFFLNFAAVFYSRESYFTIFVSLYFQYMLIIPGCIHLANGQFPFYNLDYEDRSCNTAAIIVLLFSIFYSIGYFSVKKISKIEKNKVHLYIDTKLSIILSILLILISFIFGKLVGFSNFMLSRSDQSFSASDIAFIISLSIPRFASFVSMMIAMKLFIAHKRRSIYLLFVLFTIPIFIFFNFPIAISRFALFGYIISMIVAFGILKSLKGKLFVSVIYPFFSLTIFPMISNLARGQKGVAFWDYNIKDYYMKSGDFDGMQSLINVVNWIDKTGLQFGKQLMGVFLFFIPRSLWQNKPQPTGAIAAAYNGYEFTNISSPLPSEIYSDFGIFGLIIISCFIGVLARNIENKIYCARTVNNFPILLICSLMCANSVILMRGSLLAVIAPISLSIILSLSTLILNRKINSYI